jgi:hypothetical protein
MQQISFKLQMIKAKKNKLQRLIPKINITAKYDDGKETT